MVRFASVSSTLRTGRTSYWQSGSDVSVSANKLTFPRNKPTRCDLLERELLKKLKQQVEHLITRYQLAKEVSLLLIWIDILFTRCCFSFQTFSPKFKLQNARKIINEFIKLKIQSIFMKMMKFSILKQIKIKNFLIDVIGCGCGCCCCCWELKYLQPSFLEYLIRRLLAPVTTRELRSVKSFP